MLIKLIPALCEDLFPKGVPSPVSAATAQRSWPLNLPRPTKSPLNCCSPFYVLTHMANETIQTSQQRSPEAQSGVAASSWAQGRAGWGSTAVSHSKAGSVLTPAPLPHRPQHTLTWECPTLNTGHRGNSTLGYEQWTNAISPQSISLLEFVCTWIKLNWKMLWCCLPCWENSKAWNTSITLFFAQCLETLKNGYIPAWKQ